MQRFRATEDLLDMILSAHILSVKDPRKRHEKSLFEIPTEEKIRLLDEGAKAIEAYDLRVGDIVRLKKNLPDGTKYSDKAANLTGKVIGFIDPPIRRIDNDSSPIQHITEYSIRLLVAHGACEEHDRKAGTIEIIADKRHFETWYPDPEQPKAETPQTETPAEPATA